MTSIFSLSLNLRSAHAENGFKRRQLSEEDISHGGKWRRERGNGVLFSKLLLQEEQEVVQHFTSEVNTSNSIILGNTTGLIIMLQPIRREEERKLAMTTSQANWILLVKMSHLYGGCVGCFTYLKEFVVSLVSSWTLLNF